MDACAYIHMSHVCTYFHFVFTYNYIIYIIYCINLYVYIILVCNVVKPGINHAEH